MALCAVCCSVIQDIVQGPARVLQEAVAEDCCQQLLHLDARVSAVQVYIRKPHVALTGTLDSVGELWCSCQTAQSARHLDNGAGGGGGKWGAGKADEAGRADGLHVALTGTLDSVGELWRSLQTAQSARPIATCLRQEMRVHSQAH